MTLETLILFIIGLVFLVAGAEVLVRGAARLAAVVGISPLIVGLTVVSFGTSSPELAVCIQSGLSGETGISIGNVIGSNIFNVLVVLGLSAIIVPLLVSQQLVRLDVPLMIFVSLLTFVFALDGSIGRVDGLIFCSGSVLYTLFLIRLSRRESAKVQDEYVREYGVRDSEKTPRVWIVNLLFVIGGSIMLVLGSRWLIEGAVAIAAALEISNLIVGLTVVAGGTSLPEVATSVVAAMKGERDIAVGNVVGSNIFNILLVLGLSGVLVPGGITVSDAALGFDLPVMIAVAIACLPVFFSGYVIVRWEGIMFLGYYIAYTVYLILKSTQHDSLPLYSFVMIAFVIPLTVITLLTVTIRAINQHRKNIAAGATESLEKARKE